MGLGKQTQSVSSRQYPERIVCCRARTSGCTHLFPLKYYTQWQWKGSFPRQSTHPKPLRLPKEENKSYLPSFRLLLATRKRWDLTPETLTGFSKQLFKKLSYSKFGSVRTAHNTTSLLGGGHNKRHQLRIQTLCSQQSWTAETFPFE